MMSTTEWHGELVADLAIERGLLRELKMVGVRRAAAAREASLAAQEPQMVGITQPERFANRSDELAPDFRRSLRGQCVFARSRVAQNAVAV